MKIFSSDSQLGLQVLTGDGERKVQRLMSEIEAGRAKILPNNMIDYIISKKHNATVVVASNDNDFAAKCDYHVYLTHGVATVIKNPTLKTTISLDKKNDESE